MMDSSGNTLPNYRSNVATDVSCQRLCDMTNGCVGVVFRSCPSGMTCYDQYGSTWSNTYCALKSYIDTSMLNWMDNYQGTYYGEWNTGEWNTYVKVVEYTMGSSMYSTFYASTMTLSTWIKTTDAGRSLISLGCPADSSTAYGGVFSLTIDADGYLAFGEYAKGFGMGIYGSSRLKVNNGQRTHVAFVKGPGVDGVYGSIGYFYVNGTLAGTLNSFSPYPIYSYSDEQFVLGGDYCGVAGGAVLRGEWGKENSTVGSTVVGELLITSVHPHSPNWCIYSLLFFSFLQA